VRAPAPVDRYAHPKKSDELATAEFRFFTDGSELNLAVLRRKLGRVLAGQAREATFNQPSKPSPRAAEKFADHMVQI
jgi:hypothetical protein